MGETEKSKVTFWEFVFICMAGFIALIGYPILSGGGGTSSANKTMYLILFGILAIFNLGVSFVKVFGSNSNATFKIWLIVFLLSSVFPLLGMLFYWAKWINNIPIIVVLLLSAIVSGITSTLVLLKTEGFNLRYVPHINGAIYLIIIVALINRLAN